MQQATFTRPNRIFFIEGVAYRVEGPTDDRNVLMRQVETGAVKTEAVYNLMTMYLDGRLRVSEKSTKRSNSSEGNGHVGQRIRHVSPAARAVTDRHITYVTQVKEMNVDGAGKAALEEAIKQIAEERKDKNRPHVSTVYGWLRKFSTDGLGALISRMSSKGSRRKPKIDPEVSAIVDQQVHDVLDNSHVWSAEQILDKIRHEINLKNKFKVPDEYLKEPSLRTVQRRLAELPQFDVAVAKHGLREAERRFANLGVARRTSRILELVEVDHSPLDILVVDERGVVVGRPMLTLVLDRFSRCVLGFHLSLDGHGTHSVFAALRHALLPKLYLDTGAYESLGLAWPCHGWFERLLMDNGLEFHSESSVDALLNLGIIGEYAASQSPNDKPHVERVLKTVNYSFISQGASTSWVQVGRRGRSDSGTSGCDASHLDPTKVPLAATQRAQWQDSSAGLDGVGKGVSAAAEVQR
jgi:putative transposase